jgi:hypothetical protein
MSNVEPALGQDNTNTNKPKMGRPLKFASVADLQAKIDKYFADCEPHPVKVIEYKWHEVEEEYETTVRGKVVRKTRLVNDYDQPPEEITRYRISEREAYSVTGLALALDTSRKVLLDYEDGKYDSKPSDDDYDPLDVDFSNTIKKAKIKIEHDVQRRLETNAVAGTIFNLKNNFGWIDKQVEEGTQEVIVTTRKHKHKA